MVNRTFHAGYNRKRIRRLMRMHGLMLAPRVHRPMGGRTSVRLNRTRFLGTREGVPT